MVVPSSPVTSKSPILVTHVAAWIQSIGGVETLLRYHRERDSAAGFDARQIALFDKTDVGDTAAYSSMRFSGWNTPAGMRRALRRALARRPASVVLWHNGWGLPWFADGDRSHRRIVCWWDSQTHWGPWLEAVKPWVDGVVCMSDAAADHVASRWPELPAERRLVLRVPIAAPPQLNPHRSPHSEWVIGCAGRLVRAQKRAERLVPFVAALKQQQVPFRIEVVSDGPLREHLQRELGDDPAVQFLGWQSGDDYWTRMQGWDAMVSFTDHEGGPIVMLEAMAAGVLPIFPAIGGSLVDDYLPALDSRLVYPPGDVATAARRMKVLSKLAPTELDELRVKARGVALKHTVGRYHDSFAAFIREVSRLPRVSRPPDSGRGTRLADMIPLGGLTRLSPASLWR